MNDTLHKILSLKKDSLESIEKSNGRLVICYGHFNMIHPGHMRYLKYARTLGDVLVVALQDDTSLINSEAEHYFKQNDRAEGVSSLHIVDYVVIIDDGDLDRFIEQVKPFILVLGTEHETRRDRIIDASINVLNTYGGKVVYHAGEARYSTADLLYARQDDLTLDKLKLFKKANGVQD